jgi:hypothetical protein
LIDGPQSEWRTKELEHEADIFCFGRCVGGDCRFGLYCVDLRAGRRKCRADLRRATSALSALALCAQEGNHMNQTTIIAKKLPNGAFSRNPEAREIRELAYFKHRTLASEDFRQSIAQFGAIERRSSRH